MDISIVGLGGTGSLLAEPLIRFMYSKKMIGKITFIDGDKYEEGNIDRQSFATSYIGTNKAEYAHTKFTRMFDDFASSFHYIDRFIGKDDLAKIATDGGAMFCCVDNHFFRKIADEHVSTLKNFLLISAGNEMVTGNVQTVQMLNGENITKHTVRSRHRDVETAEPAEDRSEMSCEQLAALPGGGQIIVANMMAATLMLSHFISFALRADKRDFYESFFDCKTCTVSSRELK